MLLVFLPLCKCPFSPLRCKVVWSERTNAQSLCNKITFPFLFCFCCSTFHMHVLYVHSAQIEFAQPGGGYMSCIVSGKSNGGTGSCTHLDQLHECSRVTLWLVRLRQIWQYTDNNNTTTVLSKMENERKETSLEPLFWLFCKPNS